MPCERTGSGIDPHQVASVAQLAEQLTLNQLVEGSSPSRGTTPLLFIFEFGRPAYKGTRIMVWQILEALAHGESVDDLVRAWHGRVSRRQSSKTIRLASNTLPDAHGWLNPHLNGQAKQRLRKKMVALNGETIILDRK